MWSGLYDRDLENDYDELCLDVVEDLLLMPA
jgi:hypothetical protein